MGDSSRRSPYSPARRSRSLSPPARGNSATEHGAVERGGGGGGGGVSNNPGNNIYVANVSTRCSDEQLLGAFSKYGPVSKCQIMRDPHTNDHRGFAFVTMEHYEDADRAIEALNGLELEGRAIRVERAKRGRPRTPTPGRYYGPAKARWRDDRGGYGGGGGSGYGGGGGPPHHFPPPPSSYRDRYDPRDRYHPGGYSDRDYGGRPPRGGYSDRDAWYERDRYYDRERDWSRGGGYERGGGGGGYGPNDRYDRRY